MLSQAEQTEKKQSITSEKQSIQIGYYPSSFMGSLTSYISTNISCSMNNDTEATYFPKQAKIIICHPRNHLYYFAVSSQPSRKFDKATYVKRETSEGSMQHIEIQVKRSANIIEHLQRFCILGYNRKLNMIEETIGCRVPTLDTQCIQNKTSVLYISRNIAQAKIAQYESQQIIENPIKINRPHELNAHEIQILLEYINQKYGSFNKITIKRNILIVQFDAEVLNKENLVHTVNPFIISKKVRTIEDSKSKNFIRLFKYYTITTHRPIFYTNPVSLIQFPPQTKVVFLQFLQNWVILATSTEVVFFHIDAPLDNFMTVPDLEVQGISIITDDKIALMEYKYLHIYHLNSRKKPSFIKKIKIRRLEIFTICVLPKGDCLIAGIDHSSLLNSRVKEKSVHLLLGFSKANLKNKQSIMIDESMLVCSQHQDIPISHLTYISSAQTFVCCCDQTIYLCHFQTQSVLAQVQLKGSIKRIMQVQYPINIANVLILTRPSSRREGEDKKKQFVGLVRIGFDEYCGCVGTEVENVMGNGENVRDFFIEGRYILSTDGKSIIKYIGLDESAKAGVIMAELNMSNPNDGGNSEEKSEQKQISEQKKLPLSQLWQEEEEEKYLITKLIGGENQIIFSVQKEHTVQIYFLEV